MPPCLAKHDAGDRTLVDSEASGYCFLGMTVSVQRTDGWNVSSVQLAVAIMFTTSGIVWSTFALSIASKRIAGIGQCVPDIQVVRTHTRRYVAVVADEGIFWDQPDEQLVRDPMRSLICFTESPVALFGFGTLPQPTSIGDFDVAPKHSELARLQHGPRVRDVSRSILVT